MRFSALTLRGGGTVISGALTSLGGQALVWGLGFPTSVLVARAVGAEGRGAYYLPVVASLVAAQVAQLSLESANIVATSERGIPLRRLSRSESALALCIGPVAALATTGFFFLFEDSVFEGVTLGNYLIAAVTVPLYVHLMWMIGLFAIAKRVTRTQVAMVAGSAVYLVAASVLYAIDVLDVTLVLVLYAVSIAIPWLLHALWSGELGGVRPAFDWSLMRQVAGIGARLHPGQLALFMLLKFDIFLVSLYLGVEEVGLYSLAVLLADLAVVGGEALSRASIAFQVERPLRESAPLAFKAARFNFLLAGAMALFFAATFWLLIPTLYGDEFRESYDALVVLLPGVCALAATRPLMVLLPRLGRPLRYNLALLTAFALNCVANAILLPAIGIVGASVASSLAYVTLAALFGAWAMRAGGLRPKEALLPQRDDLETLRRIVSRFRPA